MTLGLPPAGIFWQPAGVSPSPNSLPSPLRSFVPRSCSAHLSAVRVSEARREGTGGPASAPNRPPPVPPPPRPPPPPPPAARPVPRPPGRSPAPPPHLPAGEDGTERRRSRAASLRAPRPLSLVPRGGGGAQKRDLVSLLRARRLPRQRRRHQPSAASFSCGPFFPGLGRVRLVWFGLVTKLQQMGKRPSPPPPRGRKGSFRF